MKVEFKPNASWNGGKNYVGRGSVQVSNGGMNYKVSASDNTLGVHGGGLSTRDLALMVEKPGAFTLDYDVANHAPTFTLHSSANVAGKDVGLKYKHNVRKGGASLDSNFKVDAKHSGTVSYNLQGYDGPDLKSCALKWKYKHDDKWLVEPEYNFGSNAFSAAVTHQMDSNNKLKMNLNASSMAGGLEWNQKQNDGNMKVSMKSTLTQKSFMNDMSVHAEKTFNFDV